MAVLGFFGVKDGELDRVLRNAPGESVVLFGIVLAGVGLSFAVPIVGKEVVRLSYPLFVVSVATIVSVAAVRRFEAAKDGWDVSVLDGGVALACAALLIVTFGTRVGKQPALLVVAAWLVGVGTLGATALAVQVRAANDSVRVTAAMGSGAGGDELSVEVSATRLKSRQSVSIEVLGVPIGTGEGGATACAAVTCTLLHQVRLGPADDGNVSRSVKLAIPPGRYEQVVARGRMCEVAVGSADVDVDDQREPAASGSTATSAVAPAPPMPDEPDDAPTRDDCTERVELGGLAVVTLPPIPSRPVISAATDDKGLTTVSASASSVRADGVLCGTVTIAGSPVRASVSQGPSATGAASFTVALPSLSGPADVEARAWVSGGPCADQAPEASALMRFHLGAAAATPVAAVAGRTTSSAAPLTS